MMYRKRAYVAMPAGSQFAGMLTVAGTIHFKNGFFSQNCGYEIIALSIGASLALAFAGHGA